MRVDNFSRLFREELERESKTAETVSIYTAVYTFEQIVEGILETLEDKIDNCHESNQAAIRKYARQREALREENCRLRRVVRLGREPSHSYIWRHGEPREHFSTCPGCQYREALATLVRGEGKDGD